jgi:predicted ArsR family transcriptional regulator
VQNTRSEILKLIQLSNHQTVSQLAVELELAPATVRRHLDILQRDGLLDFEEKREGAGRPEHVFRLTPKGFETGPREYDRLLIDMISEVANLTTDQLNGKSGTQVIKQVFETMADRIAKVVVADETRAPIDKLLELLELRHYDPEWDTNNGTIRIQLNNCPYRSAAMMNPVICSFDSRLIASVMGSESQRSQCVRDGSGCCLYEIELAQDTVSTPVGGTLADRVR